MKYRSIRAMRNQIQKWRQRTRPMRWVEICERLGILTEDGRPNTGLAEDIGFKVVKVHGEMRAYQPTDPAVRERLGLAPVCVECQRPYRSNAHKAHAGRELPPHQAWWKMRTPAERDEYIRLLFAKFA